MSTTNSSAEPANNHLSPALPSPPFHFAEGIANLRDLGGYAISPTTSLRRNFLYRSARLTTVTPAGANTLSNDLGITTIYDFRSDTETTRAPSLDIPHVVRKHVPVFRDVDASPEGLALRFKDYAASTWPEGFVRAYREILRCGASGGAYRTVFEHVRDRPTEPLLFHCTGGKDRTGVFAALVLRIAGVTDDEVIGQEYELTELGLAELKAEFVEGVRRRVEFLANDDAGVERMLSAKKEAIMATLAWVDAEYGSVEWYMKKEMGFGDEDLAKIRKNLIVEEKATL